jgi:hypothetical protein
MMHYNGKIEKWDGEGPIKLSDVLKIVLNLYNDIQCWRAIQSPSHDSHFGSDAVSEKVKSRAWTSLL